MAIVGITTGLDVTIQATTLKTNLIWVMEDATAKGTSSTLANSAATDYLGKSLLSTGARVGARVPRVALNDNQLPV
jgi:hypothetical protein